MSNNTVMKYVMKPAICGIVGKLAASALIGVDGSGSLPLFGMDWAPSTVIGVSVAGATIAAAAALVCEHKKKSAARADNIVVSSASAQSRDTKDSVAPAPAPKRPIEAAPRRGLCAMVASASI